MIRRAGLLSFSLLLALIAVSPVSAASAFSPAHEEIEKVIADWISVGFAIAALLFIIYMVWNLAQAQFASFMNVPRMHAAAIEQAGIAILLIAVAACARPISDNISGLLLNSGSGFDSVKVLLIGLAEFSLSLILGLVVAVTFLAAVWSVIRVQTNIYLGRPGGLSQAITNLIAVLMGGAAVFLSLPLSKLILDTVAGH
jgi:hypothetical protein